MKKITYYLSFALIVFYLLSSFSNLHTYYISICNIEYFEKSNELGVSFKFTAHDMEKAIIKKSNIDLHLGEKNQHPKTDSLLNNYISNKFIVQSDEKINLRYIGNEFSLDETLMVYFEVKNVVNPMNLKIENSLLTEVFNKQENVVHVELFKKTKTYSFNKINTNYTFKFN